MSRNATSRTTKKTRTKSATKKKVSGKKKCATKHATKKKTRTSSKPTKRKRTEEALDRFEDYGYHGDEFDSDLAALKAAGVDIGGVACIILGIAYLLWQRESWRLMHKASRMGTGQQKAKVTRLINELEMFEAPQEAIDVLKRWRDEYHALLEGLVPPPAVYWLPQWVNSDKQVDTCLSVLLVAKLTNDGLSLRDAARYTAEIIQKVRYYASKKVIKNAYDPVMKERPVDLETVGCYLHSPPLQRGDERLVDNIERRFRRRLKDLHIGPDGVSWCGYVLDGRGEFGLNK